MANLVGGLLSILPTKATMQSRSKTQLITTAVLAAVPLWIIIKKLLKKRPKCPYPPGPKGVFFFGNTLDFPDPDEGGFVDEKFLEWSKEFGTVFTLKIPIIGRMIIVADPDLVKHINVSRNYPKSPAYNMLDAVVGSKSMVIVGNKEWAPLRKAFNPGFAPSFLKGMTSTMNEKMMRFLDCVEADIKNEVPTNMLSRAQTFTSDVIVTIAFGEDWGGDNPHPARMWETEICRNLNGLIFNPRKLLFGFETKRKVRYYEKLLDQEMLNILERRLAAGTSEDSKDICSLAINCMKSSDGSLTEDDKISIAHQLKTFYFAGHDTTGLLGIMLTSVVSNFQFLNYLTLSQLSYSFQRYSSAGAFGC